MISAARRILGGAFLTVFFLSGAVAEAETRASETMPWNLEDLSDAPAVRWIEEDAPIRELAFTGEPYRGEPTEVFAFYGSPATLGLVDDAGEATFPAIVLVHGGGGTAFAEWVWMWAQRGYAAIAMDLSGRRPPSPEFDPASGELTVDHGKDRKSRTRLERGGPEQGHPEKFASVGGEVGDDWPFHAIATVIRAHSLIRSFPEVDPGRTAITGISWGGYTTCIAASVDHRFAAAVPVYGCGFLHEGESVQKNVIDSLGPEQSAEWVALYDPSKHLPRCRVPMLFVNGTHDIHYPLDSYAKSYELVPGSRELRIELRMNHSHQGGWKPEEIGIFVDRHCNGGDALPVAGVPALDGERRVRVPFASEVPVVKATLHYTVEGGKRSKREWVSVDAEVRDGEIVTPPLPAEANTWLVNLVDERGAMVSSEVGFAE